MVVAVYIAVVVGRDEVHRNAVLLRQSCPDADGRDVLRRDAELLLRLANGGLLRCFALLDVTSGSAYLERAEVRLMKSTASRKMEEQTGGYGAENK